MGRDSENLIDFATTDNKIILRVNNVDEVELVENALSPVTSDGVALGTGSLMWSDLFLASGSVINFNNGNITVTHSSNTLTVAGGTLAAAAITGTTSYIGNYANTTCNQVMKTEYYNVPAIRSVDRNKSKRDKEIASCRKQNCTEIYGNPQCETE